MKSKIFVSYRRDDTLVYAQSLVMALGHHFGEENIFLDTENIEPGQRWMDRIDEELKNSKVILILIGNQWLTVTDKNQQRRLDDPEDVVRKEVAQALTYAEQDKNLVPVLLEGAKMPSPDKLPEPLAQLPQYNAVSIQDGGLIKETPILIKHLEEILNSDQPVEKSVQDLKREIKFRRLSVLAAAGLGILVFLAAWVGLVDRIFFDADRNAKLWTIHRGDTHAEKTFSDDIALVTFDAVTEKEYGKGFADRSFWRGKHAELITKLGGAGAKVIAFDVAFSTRVGPAAGDAGDIAFKEAAQKAAEKGCSVLIVANRFQKQDDHSPAISPTLGQGIGGWGSDGISKSTNGQVFAVDLAVLKRKLFRKKVTDQTLKRGVPPKDEDDGVVIPSFSLQCLAAFRGADHPDYEPRFHFDPSAPEEQVKIEFVRKTAPGESLNLPDPPLSFSCFEKKVSAKRSEKGIRDKGDASAAIALDLSPREAIRKQTLKHEDVLGLSATDALSLYEGKIVLIGRSYQPDESDRIDEHTVCWDMKPERRWGVELHADAVNSLLKGVSIHGPPGLWKLILVVGLFAVGAFIKTRLVGRRWYWHWVVLVALLVAYYAASMFFYAQDRFLLSLLDGVLAFSLSFLIVGKVRKLV